MNLEIFRCYINICILLGIIPSWEGLERFRLFCLGEIKKVSIEE